MTIRKPHELPELDFDMAEDFWIVQVSKVDGNTVSARRLSFEAMAKARYEQSIRERIMASESAGLWKPPAWEELEPRARYRYTQQEKKMFKAATSPRSS